MSEPRFEDRTVATKTVETHKVMEMVRGADEITYFYGDEEVSMLPSMLIVIMERVEFFGRWHPWEMKSWHVAGRDGEFPLKQWGYAELGHDSVYGKRADEIANNYGKETNE